MNRASSACTAAITGVSRRARIAAVSSNQVRRSRRIPAPFRYAARRMRLDIPTHAAQLRYDLGMPVAPVGLSSSTAIPARRLKNARTFTMLYPRALSAERIGRHLLPEAGATQERTLWASGTPWFGKEAPGRAERVPHNSGPLVSTPRCDHLKVSVRHDHRLVP